MIVLWATLVIIASIIIAHLRGGRLSNFSNLNLRFTVLLLLGLIFRFLIWSDLFLKQPYSASLGGYFFNLSNILILSFLIANWKIPGVPIIFLGNFSNALTIALNGGRMPFSLKSVEIAGLTADLTKINSSSWYPQVAISKKTLLPFLGDVIPIPLPGIFATLISIGDIIVLAGIFWLIQATMVNPQNREKKPKA